MENKVQMVTMVDSRTGMVMYVETKDSIVDLRPYGSPCDFGAVEWDFD